MNNARVGDQAQGICYSHQTPRAWTGTIINGAGNVLVNGLPSGRLGDQVLADCGHIFTIISGSGSVVANGLKKGRLGDQVQGPGSGTIISGSGNVQVGG